MMKRKLLICFAFLLFCFTMAFSQKMAVSGKISDAKGEPLVGASLVEKGTSNGTLSDADGNFTLSVDKSATIVASFVGYLAQDVAVSGNAKLDITLQESSALNEVVVTALGISREKKSLGYAAQELKGSDITAAPEVSPINNLAGQVAGLTLTRGTYGPGASTRVVLRGERLIAGDNQPLYIVDGVPLDNSTNGTPGEFSGADAGDGISNINPDDIESISVLKGPNAAALYGSRANNGAIIITTKKGAAGKTQISYALNYATEAPSYQLKSQNRYGQGDAGRFGGTSDNSWGSRMDTASNVTVNGTSYKPTSQDHIGAFLRNGDFQNHNLSITTGTDRVQSRFSTSLLSSKGLVTGNDMNRISLNLRTSAKLTDALTWDTKVNYIYQRQDNRPGGGEEMSNPYSNVVRMPVSYPNEELSKYELIVDGVPKQNFYNNNSVILGNPYWVANRMQLLEKRNRIIGLTSLTWDITKGLSLLGRIGLDQYEDGTERRNYAGTPTALTANSTSGNFSTASYKVREINADFLLRYDTKISKDLNLTVSAGGNTRRNSAQNGFSNAGGLDYLNLFSFSNGRVLNTGASGPNERTVNSFYGLATIGFRDYLYVDITGRNDWSSTLSAANRSYFYPSVSAAFVLSEAVKMPESVSFAKLRASYAAVGNDTRPYQLQQYLTPSAGVVGTILTNNAQKVVGEELLPQQTQSFEIGADMKFMQNRLGFDVSYYKTNTINQILAEALRASSGFSSQLLNAGDIQNAGVEVLFNATPIKKAKLRWDVTLNYTRNRNKVVRLSDKLNNYGFSGNRVATTAAKVGDRLGELFVKGYERDASGNILIDTSRGLPVLTAGRTVYVGNIAPDWTGGVRNAITFGAFKFDFLIDLRMGGVVVSHTQAVLAGAGKAEETVVNGERANIVVAGTVGVKDAAGKWSAGSGSNTKPVSPETYWKFLGGRGEPVGEAFTYDASVVRLRQMTLSYTIPKKMLNNYAQSITVGVYGRNLWFQTKEAPFDPEVALNTGIGGQGIDFYGMPTTRTLGVNLNVNF